MIEWLALSFSDAAFLVLITFAAGVVRGFAGFALSALIMAIAVTILPPVQLIPILWFLEMAASLVMARGGWRDADRRAAMTLVLGTWVGWPLGLWLTTSLSVAMSKTVALGIILALAAAQLAKLRMPFLASQSGTAVTGIVAGVASGLAHIGGMVVALYALAREADARTMRGTLVTFLFVSSIGSFAYQIAFGVMDGPSLARAALLIPPTLIGVWLGTRLFTENWAPYYRPFCLWLLIGLAALSLIRHLA